MKKRKPFEWLLDFVEIPGAIFGALMMQSVAFLRLPVRPGNEWAGFAVAVGLGWFCAWLIDRRKPVTSPEQLRAKRYNWPPRFALAGILATFSNVVILIAPEIIKKAAL